MKMKTIAGRFELIMNLLFQPILDKEGFPTGKHEETGLITKKEALALLNGEKIPGDADE